MDPKVAPGTTLRRASEIGWQSAGAGERHEDMTDNYDVTKKMKATADAVSGQAAKDAHAIARGRFPIARISTAADCLRGALDKHHQEFGAQYVDAVSSEAARVARAVDALVNVIEDASRVVSELHLPKIGDAGP